MLNVTDLHSGYGLGLVLHGIDLDVAEGEVVGILGRNGMGKTTLIHSIMGIVKPTRGAVCYLSAEISGWAPERIARRGIALVPQGHRVFPSLTVEENIRVAYRKPAHDRGWNIDEVFDHLPILKKKARAMSGVLSGGQQQLLLVARALVRNAGLVMMDEPTEGLDPTSVALVGGIVSELRTRGTSVVIVEQKVEFTLGLVDRVCFIERGRVAYRSSTPRELVKDVALLHRYVGIGVNK